MGRSWRHSAHFCMKGIDLWIWVGFWLLSKRIRREKKQGDQLEEEMERRRHPDTFRIEHSQTASWLILKLINFILKWIWRRRDTLVNYWLSSSEIVKLLELPLLLVTYSPLKLGNQLGQRPSSFSLPAFLPDCIYSYLTLQIKQYEMTAKALSLQQSCSQRFLVLC